MRRWTVRLLVLGAVLAALVPASVVLADSVVTFADSNLQAAVRECIGKPDGDIYESDIQALGSLNASGRGISSLGGLEACQNAAAIDLSQNSISSLAPLSGLEVSGGLDLDHNSITNISSLTNLKVSTLDLSYNDIRSLAPLDPGTASANHNEITGSLNLLGNKNLDCDAHNTYIPALQSRGVSVQWEYILPDRPKNVSPADGDTGVGLTPTLQASAFHSKDGRTFLASTWQVFRAGEDLPFWMSGESAPAEPGITIPEGVLDYSRTYSWRVGYRDSNRLWSCYSLRTSFTTTADPGPTPLGVSTGAAGSLADTSATLNGSLTGTGGASSVQVSFQWGPTTAYSGGTTGPQTMTHAGAFSATVPGLAPGTTYHFRAMAVGDTTAYGDDAAFTTLLPVNQAPARPANLQPGPGAENVLPTPVLQASAYSDPENDSHAASFWQVRSETGSYDSAVWSLTTAGSATVTVPEGSLKHLKRYYWRVRYQDGRGAWSEYSAETLFGTADYVYARQPENAQPAPGAAGVSLTPVLAASDYFHPESYPHVACSWQIRSVSRDYDHAVWESGLSSPPATSITVPEGELACSTTYYWRVGYQDSRGLWSSYSKETQFTTVDSPLLQVMTESADGVGSESATLRLKLEGMGSAASVQVWIEWGPTEDYGAGTAPMTVTDTGDFTWDLTGLTPETLYHFRAAAAAGSTVHGDDLTFRTLPGGRMPPAVNTGEAETTASGSIRIKGELAWMGTASSVTVSFVWGTAEAGPYLNETVGSARTAVGSFQAELTGLAPGATCYYKARGVGDGTGYGVVQKFTTAGLQPVVRSLMANSGRQGEDLTLTITGTNLDGATAVTFGEGIAVIRLQVMSASLLTVEVSIDHEAAAGLRDVAVTTARGTATMVGGFEVKDAERAARLWVYLAAGAGGLLGLTALGTVLALVLRRRPAEF